MEFLDVSIQNYIIGHTSPEPALLQKLNRETHANILMPRMLSGHVQGRLLSLISQMIRPRKILEIGTFTGYSAICMAEGLQENGTLVTIDKNEELEDLVKKYFQEAGLADKINFLIGNALDIIPKLKGYFDLVFIDADKANYQNYFNLVIDKVASGGFIIADNVLWSGKVVAESDKPSDKDTNSILKFNEAVQQDERVTNTILPVRDGLMIIRKN
ncbi:O-methyltransferase [soil metagenome]